MPDRPIEARPCAPFRRGCISCRRPIGAARDITLRALDVLAGADVLVAEDTRTLRHLMEIHGIALGGRPLIAYHDHNGEACAAAAAAGCWPRAKSSPMPPRPGRR